MNFADFVTVDVFAERAFEGNQLAVFPEAAHVPEALLPNIAQEFKLPETTFVLPPENGGDARVRIFTPDGEAAFAGHPLVGTAVVLATRTGHSQVTLEVPAGGVVIIADDESAPGTQWVPVFAEAVGAPAPKKIPGESIGRPVSNKKARSLGWTPSHGWREGFRSL